MSKQTWFKRPVAFAAGLTLLVTMRTFAVATVFEEQQPLDIVMDRKASESDRANAILQVDKPQSAGSAVWHSLANNQREDPSDPLRPHELFLSWNHAGNKLLVILREQAYLFPSGKRISMPGFHWVSYVRWNPDDSQILIGNKHGATVLRSANLSVVSELPARVAWWNGGDVEYISGDRLEGYSVVLKGRTYRIPPEMEITASTEDGNYVMAWTDYRREADNDTYTDLWIYTTRPAFERYRRLREREPYTDRYTGDILVQVPATEDFIYGNHGSPVSTYIPLFLSRPHLPAQPLWSGDFGRATPGFHFTVNGWRYLRYEDYTWLKNRTVLVGEHQNGITSVRKSQEKLIGFADSFDGSLRARVVMRNRRAFLIISSGKTSIAIHRLGVPNR